jgi:flagellar motility protein MotE (MotC chaperone)
MLSCDIKKETNKYRSTHRPGLVSVAFFCSLSILLVVGVGYSVSSAQEKTVPKKTEKKIAKPQDSKSAQTSSAGVSIEEERLKILNSDIQAKLDQLKKLRQEIDEVSKGLEPKKKAQLVKVVKMYESMPAEDAAKAIEKLDDETALQILTTIKARNGGQILAVMDPARVASLSKKAILKGNIRKEKSSP